MGFICSICADHKSGMAVSYPLDAFHQDWPICRECDSKKEDLIYYSSEGKSSKRYQQAKSYFEEKLRENSGIRPEVRGTVQDFLKKYDQVRMAKSQPSAAVAKAPGIPISTGALPEEMKIRRVVDVFSVSKVYVAGAGLGGWLADIYLDRMAHLEELRLEALRELVEKAQKSGATALTGVQFQMITLSDNYYGILVTGTGVVTECGSHPAECAEG